MIRPICDTLRNINNYIIMISNKMLRRDIDGMGTFIAKLTFPTAAIVQ